MKYTREVLAPIVAASRSLAEVMRKLGLRPTGGNHRMITARVRLAGLDTSHFVYGRAAGRDVVPDDKLRDLVETSRSVAQILAKLGLPVEGRPHRNLSAQIRRLGLDTRHFRGRGWSRGETVKSHPSVARTTQHNAFPDAHVFVENAPFLTGRPLLKRLLARGWQYRCVWCGISEWRGMKLVLHIDHINGINNDNRFENLRLLCPNCHSQTATYCNNRR